MSREKIPSQSKISPHLLLVGDYNCQFSDKGVIMPLRVRDEPGIGRLVQFFDEQQGWLPPFYPAYPAEPVLLISDSAKGDKKQP